MPICRARDVLVSVSCDEGALSKCVCRSQPPLLTLMAKAFYDKTGDNVFLKEALALLEQEHAFWMKPEHHAVEVTDPDDDSAVFLLNRYYADTDVPRPEGWKEVSEVLDILFLGVRICEIFTKKKKNKCGPLEARGKCSRSCQPRA